VMKKRMFQPYWRKAYVKHFHETHHRHRQQWFTRTEDC
jgi:hypothetical protein